jgi:hypothetical protein
MSSELETIKAFRRAGFGIVRPRVDTLTFARWRALGLFPIRGTRAVKVGGLRLFHRSQMREQTAEERQAIQDAVDAATGRREAAESNVVQLGR